MKKSFVKGISMLLLAALALSMISGFALADTVIGSRGKSYVRTEPNKGGSILGTLHKGEQAPYLDITVADYRGVNWYYISFKGGTGWVSSRYTDILSSYDDGPRVEPSYGRSVIAAYGRTYIRSGPSTEAEDLGGMPEGAYASYLEEYSIDRNGRYWYKINYHGVTGWVSARYTIIQ